MAFTQMRACVRVLACLRSAFGYLLGLFVLLVLAHAVQDAYFHSSASLSARTSPVSIYASARVRTLAGLLAYGRLVCAVPGCDLVVRAHVL
jgi:hypothetical protein